MFIHFLFFFSYVLQNFFLLSKSSLWCCWVCWSRRRTTYYHISTNACKSSSLLFLLWWKTINRVTVSSPFLRAWEKFLSFVLWLLPSSHSGRKERFLLGERIIEELRLISSTNGRSSKCVAISTMCRYALVGLLVLVCFAVELSSGGLSFWKFEH